MLYHLLYLAQRFHFAELSAWEKRKWVKRDFDYDSMTKFIAFCVCCQLLTYHHSYGNYKWNIHWELYPPKIGFLAVLLYTDFIDFSSHSPSLYSEIHLFAASLRLQWLFADLLQYFNSVDGWKVYGVRPSDSSQTHLRQPCKKHQSEPYMIPSACTTYITLLYTTPLWSIYFIEAPLEIWRCCHGKKSGSSGDERSWECRRGRKTEY